MVMTLDADPTEVRLPGYAAGNVANASDAELAQNLEADLEHIQSLLDRCGEKPTSEGYAPADWYERANRDRNLHATESNVRRAERRVRAIRVEQTTRKEAAKAQREANVTDARDRLRSVLEAAPAEADRAQKHAREVVDASERVRQFVSDLQLMGGSTGLQSYFSTLANAATVAARELDTEAPAISPAPEGLPTKHEVQGVLAALLGKGGFDQSFKRNVPDAAKVDDLAQTLRSKGA